MALDTQPHRGTGAASDSDGGARRPDAEGLRRLGYGNGALAVCLIALVGVVVIGAMLMLFSWVTTSLPASQLLACPEFNGCVTPSDDGNLEASDWPRPGELGVAP